MKNTLRLLFSGCIVAIAGCPGGSTSGVDAGPADGARADAYVAPPRDGGGIDAFVAPPIDGAPSDAPSDPDASMDLDAPIDAFVPPDALCVTPNEMTALIEWTDVVASEGCTFFSGPNDLGYEYPLGTEGHVTGMTQLELSGAVFSMSPTGFERLLQCPYFGSSYRFNEAIDGSWEGWPTDPCMPARPVFTGTYAYRECVVDGGRRCTFSDVGGCQITANVTIRLVPEFEVPEPTDAGTEMPDAGDGMEFCQAACDRQAMLSDGDGGTCGMPAADCVMQCFEGWNGPTCPEEQRAAVACAATVEGAFECRFGMPTVGAACEAQTEALFGCLFTPEPSGMCAPPPADTGTGAEGEACAVNEDCLVGFFCDAPTCDGPGTCTTVDVAMCPPTPMPVPACACDGRSVPWACFAQRDGVRVRNPGPCAAAPPP